MPDEKIGCARPTGSVVGESATKEKTNEIKTDKEITMVTARVGLKAPDFEAPAFHKGRFTSVNLADYLGKWVMLCFYPGDFTFV